MAFFKMIGFLAIAQAFPLGLLWAARSFEGHYHPWKGALVRFVNAASLFLTCVVSAFILYLRYPAEWWSIPACAAICGAGVSGIIAINTYRGD